MAVKLNFSVLLRVTFNISITSHLFGVKQRKLCWYLRICDGKEFQEVVIELIRTLNYVFHRWMKYFHAIASFAKQVNNIRLLEVLFVKKLLRVN